MQNIQSIQNRIYEIRGIRVLLDRDLAVLYETEAKALNQAVKRNLKRFPKDFMFRLTQQEYDFLRFQNETLEKEESLRCQNGTLENASSLRSQIVTLDTGRGKYSKYLPYAFTGQGVTMLSAKA